VPCRVFVAASARLGDQKGGVEALLRGAGELRDLPYRLEVAQFPAAAPLLEALNAGAVDIAWAGDAPTTFALAHGRAARIISAHRSNGAGTALLVRPDSPVRSVADLAGGTVATGRGSIGHALVLVALKANGLPAGAVRFAFLVPAEAKAALAAGVVDAWSSWGVFVPQAQLVDGCSVVIDSPHGVLTGLGCLSALDTAVGPTRPSCATWSPARAGGRPLIRTNMPATGPPRLARASRWRALRSRPHRHRPSRSIAR
jgi:sulfonate transport system substrate-binding protein